MKIEGIGSSQNIAFSIFVKEKRRFEFIESIAIQGDIFGTFRDFGEKGIMFVFVFINIFEN